MFSQLIPVLPFLIFLISTVLIGLFEKKDLSALEFRKEQSKGFIDENPIRLSINEYTEKKVKFSKRYMIETLCLQAGFEWSYGDYFIVCIFSGLFLGILMGILFNNPFLGVLFIGIGSFVPKRFLEFTRNKRFTLIEKQAGPFMHMTIKRYETTRDFAKSLTLTMEEFKGTEPMYSEIQKTISEINVGLPVAEAMDNLARRTGNIYIQRLSDYYKIAYRLGTEEVRKKLLYQAYEQFEENRKMKEFLKKEISEPVRDSYIMVATVPIFALFGILTMQDFLYFLLHTTLGKIGLTVITGVLLLAVWVINKFIAAPLD